MKLTAGIMYTEPSVLSSPDRLASSYFASFIRLDMLASAPWFCRSLYQVPSIAMMSDVLCVAACAMVESWVFWYGFVTSWTLIFGFCVSNCLTMAARSPFGSSLAHHCENCSVTAPPVELPLLLLLQPVTTRPIAIVAIHVR